MNKTKTFKTRAAWLLLSALLLALCFTGCQDPVLLDALTIAVEEKSDPTPVVLSRDPSPLSGETTLLFNQSIVIEFSTPMDLDSLSLSGALNGEAALPTAASFTEGDNGENSILTISPADYWTSGSAKGLTISCDSITGKALIDEDGSAGLTLTFTVYPPEITSFEPDVKDTTPNDEIVINNDTGFTALFNSEMDESSVVLTFAGNPANASTTLLWEEYDTTAGTHSLSISPLTIWPEDDDEFDFTLQAREAGGNLTENYTGTYTILNGAVHVATAADGGNSAYTGTSQAPLSVPNDALNRAAALFPNGGEVKVAEGSYAINSSTAVILRTGIDMIGGYSIDFLSLDPEANLTELEDVRNTGLNAVISSSESTMTPETLLTGFTITGGTGGDQGTAIDLQGGASPTISGNIIRTASGSNGPGRFVGISAGDSSNPIIEGNFIERSADSTGEFYVIYLNNGTSGSAEVRNNKMQIAGSGTSIAGIYSNSGGAVIRNNTIKFTGGAFRLGLYLYSDSLIIFDNNIVLSTSEDSSYGIYSLTGNDYPEQVRNNVFSGLDYVLYDSVGTEIVSVSDAEFELTTNQLKTAEGNIDSDPVLDSNLDLNGASPVEITAGGIDGGVSGEDWGFTADYHGDPRDGDGVSGWSIGADEY